MIDRSIVPAVYDIRISMKQFVVFFYTLITIAIISLTLWQGYLSYNQLATSKTCPCSKESLCRPLQIANRKEVIGFTDVKGIWPHYDWNKLTTIVLFQKSIDVKLVCYAHSKNVRVVLSGDFPIKNLTSRQQRMHYVKTNIAKVK